ncbi:MAG: hypothetical protein COW67_09630 [Flavobacteriales bacterium CG18_big_fil_WC_8_21_14_2_50_32_9]|nr:DUF423 domain-containing protein [Flavobacteriales bacterium]PIQ15192.1 MAG: hypothetical protein COW67_09630 [Flavobacteriales bacterium CG18_big_fil_WC_8_21_14_2_50_32_9]PIZ06800.1 MAG: DUF423 domain-containing protein [Flavobacteriales bacterium CG_4_10_14_0_8_um_filter_32_5]PJC62141.1 MAG: DUF423 domain-containing protein [Flavobacteriales bacterium CG_4_9_14_0_2_um_filter_32_27]
MKKSMLIKGSILGGLAVVLGAFGAHALKEVLTPEQLISFETGVRYQMYHALVLILLFIISLKVNHVFFNRAAQFIFWGVLLFSGSIYLLTIKNILGIEFLKYVAPITPIGGGLIIVGWLFILLGSFKIKVPH